MLIFHNYLALRLKIKICHGQFFIMKFISKHFKLLEIKKYDRIRSFGWFVASSKVQNSKRQNKWKNKEIF